MAIDAKGGLTIVEIKVAKADLIGDGKWLDYLEYCDRFFWAVPPHLARILEEERYLPGEAGLIVADRYDAAVMREAAHRPLAPARRKSELLHFARRAARRLSAQVDPSLGELQLAAARRGRFGFLARSAAGSGGRDCRGSRNRGRNSPAAASTLSGFAP